jgi:hypothetical protein
LSAKRRIANDNIKAAIFRPRVIQRIADNKNKGKFLLPHFDAVRTRPINEFCASNFESIRIDIHAPQTCERTKRSSSACNQCIGRRKQKDARAASGITNGKRCSRIDRPTVRGKCTLH